MPRESDEVQSDSEPREQDAGTLLTIIGGQTQLLQRQLDRMDGFSERDRVRLGTGLFKILTAARALRAWMADLPRIRENNEAAWDRPCPGESSSGAGRH
jgi:hypothetical protein